MHNNLVCETEDSVNVREWLLHIHSHAHSLNQHTHTLNSLTHSHAHSLAHSHPLPSSYISSMIHHTC